MGKVRHSHFVLLFTVAWAVLGVWMDSDRCAMMCRAYSVGSAGFRRYTCSSLPSVLPELGCQRISHLLCGVVLDANLAADVDVRVIVT